MKTKRNQIPVIVGLFILFTISGLFVWHNMERQNSSGTTSYLLNNSTTMAKRTMKTEPLLLDTNRGNYVVGINEPLLLDSDKDLLGLNDGFVAYFDWDGSMEVTLTKVTVFDSMEEAGIDSNNPFYRDVFQMSEEGRIKFVLCDILLENIDANPSLLYDDSGYYNIGSFRLAIEGISSDTIPADSPLPIFYFDGTILDATPKQLYCYSLSKGEVKEFQLGYFVDETDLNKPCALCIGINAESPSNTKYQLRFAITPDMINRS